MIIRKLPCLNMEITILSMLFSHARGGGVNWVLKKFAKPVPLSKFWIPLDYGHPTSDHGIIFWDPLESISMPFGLQTEARFQRTIL